MPATTTLLSSPPGVTPHLQRWRSSMTLLSISARPARWTASSRSRARAVWRSASGGGGPDPRPVTSPTTTCLRNLPALSTTSSHTLDTAAESKRLASGRACRASKDSASRSEQRSWSSPLRQARRRKAKAKERAALLPTLARPIAARSPGGRLSSPTSCPCPRLWSTGLSGGGDEGCAVRPRAVR